MKEVDFDDLAAKGFDHLIARARETNRERDAVERSLGFATPGEMSIWDQLRTAESAIEAGMRSGDWDCVAEGFLMLQEANRRIVGNSWGGPL